MFETTNQLKSWTTRLKDMSHAHWNSEQLWPCDTDVFATPSAAVTAGQRQWRTSRHKTYNLQALNLRQGASVDYQPYEFSGHMFYPKPPIWIFTFYSVQID